jgi:hypothetical protein
LEVDDDGGGWFGPGESGGDIDDWGGIKGEVGDVAVGLAVVLIFSEDEDDEPVDAGHEGLVILGAIGQVDVERGDVAGEGGDAGGGLVVGTVVGLLGAGCRGPVDSQRR